MADNCHVVGYLNRAITRLGLSSQTPPNTPLTIPSPYPFFYGSFFSSLFFEIIFLFYFLFNETSRWFSTARITGLLLPGFLSFANGHYITTQKAKKTPSNTSTMNPFLLNKSLKRKFKQTGIPLYCFPFEINQFRNFQT